MNIRFRGISLLAAASLLLAACTGGGGQQAPANLLEQVQQRGTLIVSTDANYAPQSVLRQGGGTRTEGTKCASDQLTAGEMEGFDIDVALELGKRLGVETCFVTPAWDSITAGNWGGRWDASVGSMTITTARQDVLHFTSPYYYTPAQFAAAASSGITSLDQLNGQAVCVGSATTYDAWLNGDMEGLGLPEASIYAQPPADVTVVPLETDQECAQAIAAGRTDFAVYLTSGTVVDTNIADGVPVVKVGSPVYSEDLAVAVDKSSSLDPMPLVTELDKAVDAMHAEGMLSSLSQKWFQADLTQAPG
jgi:polar amino acid transport system substrate-binding protein